MEASAVQLATVHGVPARHRTDALELAEWMGDRWETRRFESGVGGGASDVGKICQGHDGPKP